MRWSAWLFVVLIGLILVVGSGCREIATESADRNRAPETYLSAAPVDSVAGGGLTRVAHRYRAHWSGADLDGEVVGFFVAVTETTLDERTGVPLRLPPPRPAAYRFTIARDSLFTFSVIEGRGSDRQHALYVYSVDNQGRVDPTPAVSHFVARDQNLPIVLFTLAEATGQVFESDGAGGVRPIQRTWALTDTFDVPPHAPKDTIASGAGVRFAWRGYDKDFASFISGYLYKLTETGFVRVDSLVTSAEYGTGFGPNPGALPIGLNGFRIRAIDEAGGTTQPDALRQFFVNYSPDTWFAGPDPDALAGQLLTDELGSYFPIDPTTNWPQDFPGNPLGADTLQTLPAERKAMDGLTPPGREYRPKTFVEGRYRFDRQLRWYVRTEGDTIAYVSRVVARLGGFDRDSPYAVLGGSPASPFPVLRSGPQNGSPVAFRASMSLERATGGSVAGLIVTPFPNFDPLDSFKNEAVLFQIERVEGAGRGFLRVLAVDGDRTSDNRIGDPIREEPSMSPALRSKLLVFPLNFNPGLAAITPAADSVLDPPTDRFTLSLRATDPDPDPTNPRPPGSHPGFAVMYLAIRARIYSPLDPPTPNQSWQDPVSNFYSPDTGPSGAFPYSSPITLELDVPPTLPAGRAIIEIEVVDNASRTSGRIITVQVPIYWRVGP